MYGWKLWTTVGIVALVGLLLGVGGGYLFTSERAEAQMQTPQAANGEALERIAAALERIAAALEKGSGSPGMMGSGMMQACPQMMGGMVAPGGGPGPSAMEQGMIPQVPGRPSEATLTRTTSGAGIEVSATYMNPLLEPEEAGGKLIFKVALNTHSGNLLQFDLTELAVLRTSEGFIIDEGFIWEALSESGHHRLGYLEVEAVRDGRPLIGPETQYIELELKGIGIPSRTFKWELATLSPSP